MGKPSPPTPPSPKETSAAQTGTNLATAIANTSMGNVDQFTPYGSLTYQETGTRDFTDPYTGQTYQIPRYSATTTLNPEQQATLDATMGAQRNLGELAQERSDFLRDYLPQTEAATDQIDSKLYDLGAKRLDPRFAQGEDALRTRLTQQGITMGSEAYNREMERFGQERNDAYNSLLLSGRGQAANEVNMPINQITALLSGSQVTNPGVSMNQPSAFAPADVAGNINRNYQGQMDRYGAQMDNWKRGLGFAGGLLGGLFGV